MGSKQVATITEMRVFPQQKGWHLPNGWSPFHELATDPAEQSVPVLLLHKKDTRPVYSLPSKGMPLEIGDIIKTSRFAMIGIDWVLGGQRLIPSGRAMQVVGERSIVDLHPSALATMARGWINAHYETSTHPLVLPQGYANGIKG